MEQNGGNLISICTHRHHLTTENQNYLPRISYFLLCKNILTVLLLQITILVLGQKFYEQNYRILKLKIVIYTENSPFFLG